jgi:hypothetical protein
MNGPPSGGPFVLGPVAQWLERGTHNPLVVGSIPTWPTSCELVICAKQHQTDGRNFEPSKIHPRFDV